MAHFLVTGGAGFIGSNIAEYLVTEGEQVTIVDNLSTGNRKNLESISNAIDFWEMDAGELVHHHEKLTNIDYIIHQAAIPSVPRSIENPIASNFHNINVTLNLLEAAKKAAVKRFVFASSSSVYGHDPRVPKREDFLPHPKSPYALTKLTGEHYCRLYYELYGIETVCLRYFNVFGPRQDPKSQYAAVIPAFISSLIAGNSPTIFSDGTQTRDFTFVSNVVRANVLATSAPSEAVAGEIFNIGCGEKTSVFTLYKLIALLLDTDIQPHFAPARLGDVKDSYADISKSSDFLNYAPLIELREGLSITINFFKNYYQNAFPSQ